MRRLSEIRKLPDCWSDPRKQSGGFGEFERIEYIEYQIGICGDEEMTEETKLRIMNELQQHGYAINNINDLFNISHKDRKLIPYLLELLDYLSDERDKEFVVRCLGVKGFTEAIPKLLTEFKSAKNNYYRWAIANSINIIHSMTIEKELIELSSSKKYGTGRQMLVLSLGEYKSDLSLNCLVSLLNDEEVRGHALQALGKCGNPEVLSDIEIYCNSDNNWIKKTAINAAKKIRRKHM